MSVTLSLTTASAPSLTTVSAQCFAVELFDDWGSRSRQMLLLVSSFSEVTLTAWVMRGARSCKVRRGGARVLVVVAILSDI